MEVAASMLGVDAQALVLAGGGVHVKDNPLQRRTLAELARLSRLAAEKSAESWNTRVKQIPGSALEGTGISTASNLSRVIIYVLIVQFFLLFSF
jgi:hypothetical protein